MSNDVLAKAKGVIVGWCSIRSSAAGYLVPPSLDVRILKTVSALLLSFCLSSGVVTAQTNQASPLGTNLGGVFYATPDQPFLNILKTGSSWAGQDASGVRYGDPTVINLDANGYPISLNGVGAAAGITFADVDTLVLRSVGTAGGGASPFYPAGQYIVLYDGAGTLTYSYDAVKDVASSAPGRDVLNVTPSAGGIKINITSTDPSHTGNYIRNIRLVYAPYESLLGSGEIFNPAFVSLISPFKTLRFMDWMNTNNSTQTGWSNRPKTTDAFWAGNGGVPAEVMFALCNELKADGWFNMPPLASDDYVTQFAALAHSMLNSSLKAYTEYGNEIWNSGALATFNALTPLGYAAFPADVGNAWGAAFNYGILRAVQTGAIWKRVWGTDAGRVIRIAAGQSGYTGRNQYILSFTASSDGGNPANFSGTVAQNVDAFATAPYFGYGVPDTFTLDQLFTEMTVGGLVSGGYPGGMIKQALDWAASNYSVAQAAGLPLVAYEGGQSFVDYTGTDTALQNLYAAANLDPRMGTVYATFLNGWKSLGGTLFNHYVVIGTHSKWGYWGALENVLQTSSAKYDALKMFVSANSCWWTSCASSTATSGGTTPSSGGTTTSSGGTTPSSGGTTTSSGGTTTSSGGTTSTTAAAPIVAIYSPNNGATIRNNGNINITSSAGDPSGIASITIAADSKPILVCSNATSCSATLQSKTINVGTHTISATAVNKMGVTGRASITIVDLK